jgi:hypothetical protein
METTPTGHSDRLFHTDPSHPQFRTAAHPRRFRAFVPPCVQPTPYYTSRVKLGFALAVGERSMSGHQYVKRTRAWKRKGEKKKKLMARTNQIEFAEPETTEQMW